jgi:hypothetical protein
VYGDNEEAIQPAINPMAPHIAKHNDICHRLIRELADARKIAVIFV